MRDYRTFIKNQKTIKTKNEKTYVLVSWPEIQDFMVHERWNECIFCQEIEGHPCSDNTYAVPSDLYNLIYPINKWV